MMTITIKKCFADRALLFLDNIIVTVEDIRPKTKFLYDIKRQIRSLFVHRGWDWLMCVTDT